MSHIRLNRTLITFFLTKAQKYFSWTALFRAGYNHPGKFSQVRSLHATSPLTVRTSVLRHIIYDINRICAIHHRSSLSTCMRVALASSGTLRESAALLDAWLLQLFSDTQFTRSIRFAEIYTVRSYLRACVAHLSSVDSWKDGLSERCHTCIVRGLVNTCSATRSLHDLLDFTESSTVDGFTCARVAHLTSVDLCKGNRASGINRTRNAGRTCAVRYVTCYFSSGVGGGIRAINLSANEIGENCRSFWPLRRRVRPPRAPLRSISIVH